MIEIRRQKSGLKRRTAYSCKCEVGMFQTSGLYSRIWFVDIRRGMFQTSGLNRENVVLIEETGIWKYEERKVVLH